VLVTDDLHVVLCDFGASYVKPDPRFFFEIGPPLPYICPDGYYGMTNKLRQDIFGFGVMLFVILSKDIPIVLLVLRHLSMNLWKVLIYTTSTTSTPSLTSIRCN
jgi:hypothetical protein